GGGQMSQRLLAGSVVMCVLAGACALAGAAQAQEAAAADASAPGAQTASKAGPSPAQLSQLCRIDIKGDKKEQWMRLPTPQASVTQHRLSLGGRSIEYTATAGTLIVRDDEDRPIASIGYIGYNHPDGKSGAVRPITFAFNGGPGSSSLWLHMGVLGPKRVLVSDPTPTPAAPFRTADNEFGLLDVSDVVMIDPVGTGLSHAVCDHKDEE